MVQGGVPPMRPDQSLSTLSRAGSGPAPQSSVITPRQVIVSGPGGGVFVYNATRTVLESSDVAAPVNDPVLGIACPQGFATYNSHGKVINLLSTVNNAFFQYNDAGATQGIMILAVASTAGTDPIGGATYFAGLNGIDPAFGDTILTVGANIALSQVAYTRSAQVAAFAGSVALRPVLLINAPEQTTASHTQIQVFGESPNGATAAQVLIGGTSGATSLSSQTTTLVEVQGSMAAASLTAIVSGAVETWHTAGLAAGFAALGAPFATPGYQLEPINGGRVRLRGQVSLTANQAALTTIFTLSVGYRPTFVQNFVTNTNLNGYALGNTTIQVGTAGQVVMVPSGLTGNSVGLDGVVLELD